MKIFYLIVTIITLIACEAESQVVDFPLRITDGVIADTLRFGLDPTATNGIDPLLNESELPPMPPSGVFDSRFIGSDLSPVIPLGEGSKRDYRFGNNNTVDTVKHEIRFQNGSGSFIRLNWWSIPLTATVRIQDVITGTIIDTVFTGTGSYQNSFLPTLGKLKLTVRYNFTTPVYLAGFTYSLTANLITLRWTTVKETNNQGFEVYRRNTNSDNWEKVGYVHGNGTTNESHEYSYSERLNSGSFRYKLKQIDFNGNYQIFELTETVIVSQEFDFMLYQNYPNPFNPNTEIDYFLPQDSRIVITLFDNLGKEVRKLVDSHQSAGNYAINLSGTDLPGGVYYYELKASSSETEFHQVRKMILLK